MGIAKRSIRQGLNKTKKIHQGGESGWVNFPLRKKKKEKKEEKKMQRWSEWSNSSRKLKTEDLNHGGVQVKFSGWQSDFILILFNFISMVISFKIWQIIICSSKFSLNWVILSILHFFATKGGRVRPLVENSTKNFCFVFWNLA